MCERIKRINGKLYGLMFTVHLCIKDINFKLVLAKKKHVIFIKDSFGMTIQLQYQI